jgi:AMMECR1 domain-containing protein
VENDVEVGTHGLMIAMGEAWGLVLPQVAANEGYSREALLEAVSANAGLPPDAWQDAALYTFTAQTFSDGE